MSDHTYNPFSVTPEKAARGCLRDVGYTDFSYGPFAHDLLTLIGPRFAIQKGVHSMSAEFYKKYRESIGKPIA